MVVDVKTGVDVLVGRGVSVAVDVVVGVGVIDGVWVGVSADAIVAVGAGADRFAQINPPPKPMTRRSNAVGMRKINQRRMISILSAN